LVFLSYLSDICDCLWIIRYERTYYAWKTKIEKKKEHDKTTLAIAQEEDAAKKVIETAKYKAKLGEIDKDNTKSKDCTEIVIGICVFA